MCGHEDDLKGGKALRRRLRKVEKRGLATALEQRRKWRAKVEKFGIKTGWGSYEKTILLVDVFAIDNPNVKCDHLWFTCGKWSENLKEGDVFTFDAKVVLYTKGYKGWRNDWLALDRPIMEDLKLARPTKIEIL